MKTLIETVEAWIDSKVESNLRPWLKDMEDIHIRDANRIAELERRVLELSAYDTFSPDADAGESMYEADQMLSELASRLEDVESILEDKIDTSDVEEMIEVAINDIDLESQIFDAVRSEIDAIEFKVTVER